MRTIINIIRERNETFSQITYIVSDIDECKLSSYTNQSLGK